jgi:hypothetical protein
LGPITCNDTSQRGLRPQPNRQQGAIVKDWMIQGTNHKDTKGTKKTRHKKEKTQKWITDLIFILCAFCVFVVRSLLSSPDS